MHRIKMSDRPRGLDGEPCEKTVGEVLLVAMLDADIKDPTMKINVWNSAKVIAEEVNTRSASTHVFTPMQAQQMAHFVMAVFPNRIAGPVYDYIMASCSESIPETPGE